MRHGGRPRIPCYCGRPLSGRPCILSAPLPRKQTSSTRPNAWRFAWSCWLCCQRKHAASARSGSGSGLLPGRESGRQRLCPTTQILNVFSSRHALPGTHHLSQMSQLMNHVLTNLGQPVTKSEALVMVWLPALSPLPPLCAGAPRALSQATPSTPQRRPPRRHPMATQTPWSQLPLWTAVQQIPALQLPCSSSHWAPGRPPCTPSREVTGSKPGSRSPPPTHWEKLLTRQRVPSQPLVRPRRGAQTLWCLWTNLREACPGLVRQSWAIAQALRLVQGMTARTAHGSPHCLGSPPRRGREGSGQVLCTKCCKGPVRSGKVNSVAVMR